MAKTIILMSESEKKEMEISVPSEWAVKKLLGPVFSELGEDFRRLYALGRDKIIHVARRKTENIEDGKIPNLRVTRDVFWNGAFTDEEVCAEYFGGLLASSRTEDGEDDSCIPYVDVIKSLSASQLRLHYAIYHALNKILLYKRLPINVAQGSSIQGISVWLSSSELLTVHKINIDTDFNVLWRQGLIFEYKTDTKIVDKEFFLQYSMVKPTTFGVMLYAAAHNKMENWKDFTKFDFGDFKGIPPPKAYGTGIEELKSGLSEEA